MLAVQKSGGMSPHGPLGISAAFKRRVATGTQVPVAGAVGRGPGPVAAGDMAKGSPQPLPAPGFSVLRAVSTSAAWACCPAPAADGILATPLSPGVVPAPSTRCLLSQPKELLQAGLGTGVACLVLELRVCCKARPCRAPQGPGLGLP